MKLIIGLGNPGLNYQFTYHNLGFMTLDRLAALLTLSIKKSECDSLTAKYGSAILAKPQTFMNLSGIAVKKLMNYYKIALSDLIVVYDDIDIEKGSIRIRQSGSAGTHNGMKSIIGELNSGEFCRIRIGAGRPQEYQSLADYVLSPISRHDRQLFDDVIGQAAQHILEWIEK